MPVTGVQTCALPICLAAGQRLGGLVAFLPAEEHLAEEPMDLLARQVGIEAVQPLDRRQPLLDFPRMILRKIADRHLVAPPQRPTIEIAG